MVLQIPCILPITLQFSRIICKWMGTSCLQFLVCKWTNFGKGLQFWVCSDVRIFSIHFGVDVLLRLFIVKDYSKDLLASYAKLVHQTETLCI